MADDKADAAGQKNDKDKGKTPPEGVINDPDLVGSNVTQPVSRPIIPPAPNNGGGPPRTKVELEKEPDEKPLPKPSSAGKPPKKLSPNLLKRRKQNVQDALEATGLEPSDDGLFHLHEPVRGSLLDRIRNEAEQGRLLDYGEKAPVHPGTGKVDKAKARRIPTIEILEEEIDPDKIVRKKGFLAGRKWTGAGKDGYFADTITSQEKGKELAKEEGDRAQKLGKAYDHMAMVVDSLNPVIGSYEQYVNALYAEILQPFKDVFEPLQETQTKEKIRDNLKKPLMFGKWGMRDKLSDMRMGKESEILEVLETFSTQCRDFKNLARLVHHSLGNTMLDDDPRRHQDLIDKLKRRHPNLITSLKQSMEALRKYAKQAEDGLLHEEDGSKISSKLRALVQGMGGQLKIASELASKVDNSLYDECLFHAHPGRQDLRCRLENSGFDVGNGPMRG